MDLMSPRVKFLDAVDSSKKFQPEAPDRPLDSSTYELLAVGRLQTFGGQDFPRHFSCLQKGCRCKQIRYSATCLGEVWAPRP